MHGSGTGGGWGEGASPRCRGVAGPGRPGTQGMWGEARARGGAPSPGTREHDRGPQEVALGGCRPAGGRSVNGPGLINARDRGSESEGGGGIGGVASGGSEIACVFSSVSEGGGAEAAGVSVVERGGRSASRAHVRACCSPRVLI
jgi:hypothetical protein